MVDKWPCSVLANLTTSISTAAGRNPSALCRSVGITLVKETFWGQIAFPQDTCGGVVYPLFYLEIFTRTSTIIHSNNNKHFFIRVA